MLGAMKGRTVGNELFTVSTDELREVMTSFGGLKEKFMDGIDSLFAEVHQIAHQAVGEQFAVHLAEIKEQYDRPLAYSEAAVKAAKEVEVTQDRDVREFFIQFLADHGADTIKDMITSWQGQMAARLDTIDAEVIQHRDERMAQLERKFDERDAASDAKLASEFEKREDKLMCKFGEWAVTVKENMDIMEARGEKSLEDKARDLRIEHMQFRSNTANDVTKLAKGDTKTRELLAGLLNDNRANGVNNVLIVLQKDLKSNSTATDVVTKDLNSLKKEHQALTKEHQTLSKKCDRAIPEIQAQLKQLPKAVQPAAATSASTLVEFEPRVGALEAEVYTVSKHLVIKVRELQASDAQLQAQIQTQAQTIQQQAQTIQGMRVEISSLRERDGWRASRLIGMQKFLEDKLGFVDPLLQF